MRPEGAAALLALLLSAGCVGGNRLQARPEQDRHAYRRAHRAYDGAPPVIPHAVAALERQDCLGCHGEGMDFGSDGLAPRTPHPERVNCQQCHVEQVEGSALFAGNRFDGLRYPVAGTRAYLGSPPTMPHPRSGRESCLGCHGENGGSPVRTPHPERVNCLQCHVEQDRAVPLFRGTAFGGGR